MIYHLRYVPPTYNNFIKKVYWFSGQNWKYSQCSRRRIGKEFAKSFKPEKIRISTREINRSFHFAQSHSSWPHRNCDVSLFQSWFSRTMDTQWLKSRVSTKIPTLGCIIDEYTRLFGTLGTWRKKQTQRKTKVFNKKSTLLVYLALLV